MLRADQLLALRTAALSAKPAIMPTIDTTSAQRARRSPLDIAIPEQMMPAGPKMIGRNSTAIAPNTKPRTVRTRPEFVVRVAGCA